MRVLTAINVFDELGPGLYKSTAVSERLNEPGQADGFQILYYTISQSKDQPTDLSHSGSLLNPIVGNVSSLWSENQFTQFPDYTKNEKSPMIWTHSMNQWDIMRADPGQKLLFDKYMSARRVGLRLPWHEIYPAETELDVPGFQAADEPPLLVDVGGNTGYDAASFKARNPHIKGRCIVEDLPETLATSSVASEGIERIGYNFFTPQPIKGESKLCCKPPKLQTSQLVS